MSSHTNRSHTNISTPQNKITPDVGVLASSASLLAKERKKERKEIANRVEASSYNELVLILKRENKSFSKWLDEQIKSFNKIHGSGNPIYPLDNWIQNSQFIAVPALLADYDFIKGWLKHNKNNIKTIREIQFKLQEWQGLIKQWDYGKL